MRAIVGWVIVSIGFRITGAAWLHRFSTSAWLKYWRRERDSNPRYPLRYTRFRGARLQPLGHLSARQIVINPFYQVAAEDPHFCGQFHRIEPASPCFPAAKTRLVIWFTIWGW